MNESRPMSLAVARAHAPRLADVVAGQIRELILMGELEDGARLPTLERLLEQFGVSAPTMREALRILEAEGLVAVQRGGIGGALIQRPSPREVAYTVALVLRSLGTERRDVSQAVTLLQPICAQLCAQRPDRKANVARELRELNDAAREVIDDAVAFNERMLQFHRAVVRLSGNDTLALVTCALEDITLADVHDWVDEHAAHGDYPTEAERAASVETHERIIDLIAAGDGAGAAQAMADHIAGRSVVGDDRRVDPQVVRQHR
jgi:DNA-binding FadR family transcriptional regulator